MVAAVVTSEVALVRYGAIPEVARCRVEDAAPVERGDAVVVQTHRGLQTGVVLERLRNVPPEDREAIEFEVVRAVTAEDELRQRELHEQAAREVDDWLKRIAGWQLDVVLLDLEWTIDGEKRILYVLNDRGPDCTKLAIQAAAAGLGIVEVQPVGADGPVPLESGGGGCGSGGGCGCSA